MKINLIAVVALYCAGMISATLFGEIEVEKLTVNGSMGNGEGELVIRATIGENGVAQQVMTVQAKGSVDVVEGKIRESWLLKVSATKGGAREARIHLGHSSAGAGNRSVIEVSGSQLLAWKLENEDLLLFFAKPLNEESQEVRIVRNLPLEQNLVYRVLSLASSEQKPGDYVQGTIQLNTQNGYLQRVKMLDGIESLKEQDASNPVLAFHGEPYQLELQFSQYPDPGYRFENLSISANLQQNQVEFVWQANVVVTRVARVELLGKGRQSSGAAMLGGTGIQLLGNEHTLAAAAEIGGGYLSRRQNGYWIQFDKPGVYPVRLVFTSPVTVRGETKSTQLDVADNPGRQLSVRLPDGNYQLTVGELITHVHQDQKEVQIPLPPRGAAQLIWEEISRENNERVFYTVEGLREIQIHEGMVNQKQILKYRVSQGELRTVSLQLSGEGEVLSVKMPGLLSWNIIQGEDGKRLLRMELNQALKGEFTVEVELRETLGGYPAVFSPLTVKPVDALRYVGYARVGYGGSSKISVLKAEGMTQISSRFYPEQEKKTDQEESAPALVFRHGSPDFALTLRAEQVVPQIFVSQLLFYQVSLAGKQIEAELDVEVREAPVRRLDIHIPDGYLVVDVSGDAVSDFLVTDNAAQRQLSVFMSRELQGRTLIRLKLEQTEDFVPAQWVLLPIYMLGAELRRGFLGVGSVDGIRILPKENEGLSEISPAYLPRTPDSVYLAWRLERPEWRLEAEAVQMERSVRMDSFHLFTGAEDNLFGSSIMNFLVSGAPVQSLSFEVPGEYRNIDFVGEGVRTWKQENGKVELLFHTPVSGAFTLLGSYEIPSPDNGRKISFRGVKPNFKASELGTIVFVSPLPYRVLEKDGKAEQLDATRIPKDFQLLYHAPVVAAYQYNETETDLQLSLTSLNEATRVEQSVNSLSAITTVENSGDTVTEIAYEVQSNRAAYLALAIPQGSRLWDVKVGGQPAQPVNDGDRLLIPLPANPPSDGYYPVTVSLANKFEDTGESWNLELPKLFVPVLKAGWTVGAQDGYAVVLDSGFVEPKSWGNTSNTGLRTGVLLTAFTMMLVTFFGLVYLVQLMRNKSTSKLTRVSIGCVVILLVFLWMVAIGGFVIGLEEMARSQVKVSSLRFQTEVIPAETVMYAKIRTERPVGTQAGWSHYYWWAAGVVLWITALSGIGQRAKKYGKMILTATAVSMLVYSLVSGITALPLQIITLMGICFLLLGSIHIRTVSTVAKVVVGISLISLLSPTESHAARPLPEQILAYDVRLGVADEVSHMITIKQDQVVVNTRLSWTAKAGDRLFLLSKPAILKSSSFDKDKLVWIQESESSQLLLMAKENGSYLIEYESWLPTNKNTTSFTATLPLAAGSFSKAIVQLAMEGSWQIQSSRAIVPSITAENGKSVEMLIYPTHRLDLQWKPKPRDLSAEEPLYYADANHLIQPVAGAVLMRHEFQLRFAQGEQERFVLRIPEGQIVSGVEGKQVTGWNFNLEARTLEIQLDRPVSTNGTLVFYTETPVGNLPFEAAVTFPQLEGVKEQVGQVRLATTEELQVNGITGEGMTGNLAAGGKAKSLEDGESTELVVRQAFRYMKQGARLAFQAVPVEPEISVESQQNLSLSEDRNLLSVRSTLTVDRAGIFALHMRIPAGYDIESLSGSSLSHWTYVDEDKTLIQLNFSERVRDKIQLVAVLSGAGYDGTTGLAVPKVEFPNASRERGFYQVSPELGLKLDLTEPVRCLLASPEEAGALKSGNLLLRILGTEWSAKLNLTRMEPWVQVDTLQVYRYDEGRVEVRAAVAMQVENAGVKQLRLFIPDDPAALVVRHEQVANVRRASEKEWIVTFDRRIIGRQELQLSYDLGNPEGTKTLSVGIIAVREASRERQFVAIHSDPTIQLYQKTASEQISPILWTNIPERLRGGENAPSSNLVFRVTGSEEEVVFNIRRLKQGGDLLPARVIGTRFRTLLSDSGHSMTESTIFIHPGEERYIRVRLQEDEQLWTAAVNGETAWVWQEKGEWLIPLVQSSLPEKPSEVSLYVTRQIRGRKLSLRAPQFSLPLENIQWIVYAPTHWKIMTSEIRGDLQLDMRMDPYAPQEDEHSSIILSTSQLYEELSAQKLYALGNSLLQQGRIDEANRAFGSSYNMSQHDMSLNQDALVQWNAVRQQQAITGITNRRGGLLQDGAPRVQVTQQNLAVPLQRPQEAEALDGLARRLIEQQNAAMVMPAASTIRLPHENTQQLYFQRPVLVNNWGVMTLEIPVEREATRSSGKFLLILGVALVSIFFCCIVDKGMTHLRKNSKWKTN